MNNLLTELQNDKLTKDDHNLLEFQFQGYTITVGMNSYSNEKLVTGHVHRQCLWLHAMAARGSHVVLCREGRPEPSESVIQYAARLALRHSHSEARSVTVSLLKDMIKPQGSKLGVFRPLKAVSVEVTE